MHVAVLTGVCVKGPVVNQHALSLDTDASFLVTPPKPENWTLQGTQHCFLSAESFQLLLLPLTASSGSWKEALFHLRKLQSFFSFAEAVFIYFIMSSCSTWKTFIYASHLHVYVFSVK